MSIQLHISSAKVLIEQIAPVKNNEKMVSIKKPEGSTGLWTSTWREETQDSAWVEWCAGENFGTPYTDHWYLLTSSPDSNLYVIDSVADFSRLLKLYHYECPLVQKMRAAGYAPATIDFEALSKDYDGLHLTERGNARTHLAYPHDLNSWDSESTLWFRWCFTSVKQIAPVIPVKEM